MAYDTSLEAIQRSTFPPCAETGSFVSQDAAAGDKIPRRSSQRRRKKPARRQRKSAETSSDRENDRGGSSESSVNLPSFTAFHVDFATPPPAAQGLNGSTGGASDDTWADFGPDSAAPSEGNAAVAEAMQCQSTPSESADREDCTISTTYS